jgi:HAMP domain-containing protein
MTITTKKGVRRGHQLASVLCDECGQEVIEFSAPTISKHGDVFGAALAPVDPGFLAKRLNKIGWRQVKNRHIGPQCVAAMKGRHIEEKDEDGMKSVTRAKQTEETRAEVTETSFGPDRATLRAIRSLLDAVYDVDAGRYRGSDTDSSVAAAIGNTCAVEWVAAERSIGYGESGSNEMSSDSIDQLEAAEERLRDCLHELQEEADKLSEQAGNAMKAMKAAQEMVARKRKEVDATVQDVRRLRAQIEKRMSL